MDVLKYGSRGSEVSLLQLALIRAGFGPILKDGIFGPDTKAALIDFQRSKGIYPDGIFGKQSVSALMPWLTGYIIHTSAPGDTFYTLSRKYGSTEAAISAANPDFSPENLLIGSKITVPLGFELVPTDIPYCSALISYCILGLCARYPFILKGNIGKSVMGKPIPCLFIGKGENRVLYNASHHANEWICSPLLLKFCEDLCKALIYKKEIYGQKPEEILKYSTICLIPVVNPDGIDLVTGALQKGDYYNKAVQISKNYPAFPFPDGWSANISGIDLNLQYPANWQQAREIKFKKGIVSPAPSEFVGNYPLSSPESRAMYDFTLKFMPSLTLSYHTQGEVIYWRYLDYNPPGAEQIAEMFSTISSYSYENTPYSSGFAGYKDWFIKTFNSPGYTVEAGRGVNPLPVKDFSEIYEKNLGILTLASLVT